MSFQKKRRFQQKPKARAHALGIECLESRRMLAGPYAPAAGIEGSTAVHHLDVRIEGWASEVVQYLPGSEVNAEFQDTAQALGPADSTSGGVVSLGRGGSITVGFLNPIRDGLGFDFAVFENGFMDTFLELGKVQVSSDGINFFEFDSDSMTSDPVGSFGSVDPTEIDGFAGKYRVGFGTPFDLASLDGIDPRLDVNRVTHVRIIDVIGDGTAFDSQGDPIYDPFPTVNSAGFDLDGVAVLHGLDTGEDFVGFEDVGASLGTNGSFSGPVTGGEESEGEFGERITRGSFESGGLEFNNSHSNFLDYGFTSWSQWAYSNITDNVTAGYTNQFGVITGEAAAGSDTFGVAFVQQGEDATPPIIRKKVSDERQFGSLFVTNTTYAALSMRDGDQFAKAFGGATGDDEDFFRLTITGKDDLGSTIGSIEVYLADYRFENNAEDYILDEWLQVDLTAVATAESLEFSVDSSDVGDSGMNTPAYFAVDQIRLTEPTLFFDVDPDSITEDASVNTAAARVTRLYSDKTTALEIDVSSDVFGILDFPSSITIPAGQDYHDFTIEVIGDDLYRGDQSVVLAASVTDVGSDTASLQVIEDDPLSLQLNTAVTGIVEGNTISVAVSRNAVDLGSALAVSLTADSLGLLDVPDEVVIPLGESSVLFNVVATEDLLDRPNESLPISANADGYLESSITLNWEDNDDPELNITSQKITYSEVEALPTVGFELLGRSIEKEGYRNGSDVNGGYETKGMLLNNSYDPEWDSWSGWSISKTTDTTTPGFLNQYSSIVGQGDSGSETYAVGAVGFATVPSIVRNLGSTSSFHSVSITNTTYAVRSMLEGDFFAKKFGGETGNDPDWLLLTIEGLDAQQQSIGTLDFYLADYRFEDNQDDYIVDSWVNVPLDGITEAAELRFSMTSSDTGQYGMNTPAYFAIDQLKTVSQTASPHVQISRNTFDVATDLVVNINSSDVTEVSDIGAVKIPAGQRTISVPLPLLHDELVDGDKSVLITATSDGFASSELNLNIADSDTAQLTLSLLSETASEAGDSVQLLVHRNQEDLGQGVEVALESSPANQLNLANSIELAVGERSALTSVQALDNEIRDGDRTVTITGTASGFSAGTEELIVIDDERVLQLSMGNSQVKEADARPLSSFEDFGAKLPADSYFDGRRQSGEFLTDDVILNNEFNPTYSSWTGWAISNTTDTETAGYQNQFSSIAGTGAVGTSTYAVAYVSPGFSIPEMVISDELPDATFDSIMVSNTTYAYLSMLNGDFFGKKFGGEDGTDPDYFSLKIKGYNAAGEDVGEVEFMLADYRSSDSSEDYLAEGWNRIDLSGLTGARSLGFELDSSDIGEYGMNTPSYFAVDHLVLSEPDYVPSYLTIDRDNDEVLEELTVQLSTDDSSEVEIPAEIVIPQGVSSYDVPIHVVDNFVADGARTISLNAAAGGYLPGDLDLVIEDDDPAVLTLSVWSESQAYTEGDSVQLLVHRNQEDLGQGVEVALESSPANQLNLANSIELAVGERSALTSVQALDNEIRDGDRTVTITGTASGFSAGTEELIVIDDERVLQLSMGNSQVKEADARPLSSFEDFGAKLPADSYFDGRRQSGEFLTDDVILNNEFNPTYSSWTGWAISNTTDTETAGYQNQFSSIAGTGAVGTSTYAVAYVSPGFSIPEMVISDELPDATFDSIMVSNTTYAYLSMLNGDFFGKKFGGEDGTDPDYFSLKIKGYNAAGEDVGEVEFMLADYRSSDSSEDYLAEGWNRIDLSGLTGARSLGFELDSSDIGEYGMNTPSYFAVDHLVLSEPDYVPSYLTIDRDNDEVLEELTVQLSTDDSSEVEIPAEIVIPQGVSSYDVPIHVVDNFVADGARTISLNAAAGGYLPGDLDLVIEDDDPAVLTLSVWSESQAYTEGDSVEFFLHRNDLALNELPVSISDVNDEFIIAESVITLGIGQDSALSSIDVKQNDVLEGGRSAAVTVNANGYSDSTAQVTITDDEVAGFDVQLSSDPLLLGELADGKVALVKLLSQPLGDVYVDLDLGSATADVVADKDELVFTSANWNVDQEVLFTAIPDLIIEEDELFAWSIAVNKTLSTALYSDAETANLSLKVLEENPTHMRIVSDSELIRLVDSSSGKVISERALLEGLQITANDLTQNVEISTIGRPRGSIEFDLAGGNDSATLFTGDFDGIDGGVGEDKLSLHLEEGFNFVEFLSNRVSSFETFDLQSGPIHIQSTGLQDLAVQGERLYLTLSQDQELTFSVDAALLSPTMYEGNFVHVIQLGAVEVMSQPGKPWRNPVDPYDVHVEHPGVSALDALVVINEIGRREDRTLSEISDLSEFGGNYFDVSGDGLLSALDAVQVINELARRSDRTSGEWIVPIFGNQVANDEGRIARYIDANNVGDPNSGPDSIAAQRLPAKAASDYAGDEIGSSRMKNTPPAGELGSNLELLDQVFALLAGETNEVPVS